MRQKRTHPKPLQAPKLDECAQEKWLDGCLGYEFNQPLAFCFCVHKQLIGLAGVCLKKWTGSACDCRAQSICCWTERIWAFQGKENLGKPNSVTFQRGFLVFKTLPGNGRDIAKCVSLCGVMKCTNICRTCVSQSYVPDLHCMKLQNPPGCEGSREGPGRYCNGTNCSWSGPYCNNYPLSVLGIWLKSRSHVTGQGYWGAFPFPKHRAGKGLCSTWTSAKSAYQNRFRAKSDTENLSVRCF